MSSHSFAFIFPGQGSQHLGMLADFKNESVVQQVFEEANDTLGANLGTLCLEGPEAQLNDTRWTQPVLLTASVALWRLWQSRTDFVPQFMAGHSLGEYSALVCAESLGLADAVRLVQQRGSFMSDAVPAGVGAMAAIIGLEAEALVALCHQVQSESADSVCEAVNFNSPEQIVVSGHASAIDTLMTLAKEQGAKRAIKLPVSVPSHCALMQPAAKNLQNYIEKAELQFSTPKIPLLHNVDVATHSQHDEIKTALVKQLFQPVRWVDTIQAMVTANVGCMIECGPGKVLSGLNRRIDRSIQCFALETEASFKQASEHKLERSL
tara:strand:- start:231358 stop:232323 length:966 start_codon:yes stop_codon:yes gene_type:complete